MKSAAENLFFAWATTLPFVNGSDTSRDAAESQRGKADSQRAAIRRLIERAGKHGMTCDEIEAVTEGKHQTVSARVSELARKYRLIVDSGERRPTRSGCKAVVYVVKQ